MVKIDFLVDMAILYYKHYLGKRYSVNIESEGRLNEVKNEGFILLPKHQHTYDIPLEAILLKDTLNRRAYYVMKDSLPKIYRLVGGIPISRGKESKMILESIADKKKKRELVKKAIDRRDYVDNLMLHLLLKKEIVVFHFEGRIAYKEETKILKPIIKRLMKVQESYLEATGKEFYFVPLDFDYGDSSITLNVGHPIKTDNLDELISHLAEEVKLVRAP